MHYIKCDYITREFVESEPLTLQHLIAVVSAVTVGLGSIGSEFFDEAASQFICHATHGIAQRRVIIARSRLVDDTVGITVKNPLTEEF